jgi:hypothetical protein
MERATPQIKFVNCRTKLKLVSYRVKQNSALQLTLSALHVTGKPHDLHKILLHQLHLMCVSVSFNVNVSA